MKYLLIALLGIASTASWAQQEPKEENTKRICRILFLDKPADAPNEAFLFDGETSHEVSLPSMNFSKVIELPAGPLTIGMSPNAVSNPEEFPKGAPKLNIPAEVNDLYLLLASDPENKILPVKIKPLNVDDTQLKPGETLWINLTNHNVAAKMGDKQYLIPPMKQTVGPPPLTENGYYKVRFIYQRDGEGRFLPIMRKSWWYDSTSKNLGFIISTSARLPKIYSFRDRRHNLSTASEDESTSADEI